MYSVCPFPKHPGTIFFLCLALPGKVPGRTASCGDALVGCASSIRCHSSSKRMQRNHLAMGKGYPTQPRIEKNCSKTSVFFRVFTQNSKPSQLEKHLPKTSAACFGVSLLSQYSKKK